jgi:hypothetical protein
MTNHEPLPAIALLYKAEAGRVTNMSGRSKVSSFLGLVAAGVLSLFGKSPAKPTAEDLGRMEFKTSTQRLGIRFTEKIRDVFRFKWIRRL